MTVPDSTPPTTGGTVLVLGGGGARGLAHFGVLRVLEDAGVRVDRIIGVSIGALVGAVYCREPDAVVSADRVRQYIGSERFAKFYDRMNRASKKSTRGEVDSCSAPEEPEPVRTNGAPFLGKLREYFKATMAFHRFVMRQSILPNRSIVDCLEAITDNGLLEELQIPLTVVAADLRRGERVVIESGDIFSAVLGSMALPGIFPPVEREGALLADFGVLCSIPVTTSARYRPDTVIAVDLTRDMSAREAFTSGLEVVNRMEEIGAYIFKEHVSSFADVIIRPEVTEFDWADFHDADKVIEKGEIAAEAALPTLLRVKTSSRPPRPRGALHRARPR